MSQLVLDDQLDLEDVLPGLQSWITTVRLQELRPGEQILDDRVPEILLTQKQPTFVTIDQGFWNRKWCHPGYCIVYLALATDQQDQLADLVRRLFRLSDFHSRAIRMGKVARVQREVVTYWQAGKKTRLPLEEAV